MSKKQWMALLMMFFAYLLFGTGIFYYLESGDEIEKTQKARRERIEINELLHEHYLPHTKEDQHEIFEKLSQYCGKSVKNYSEGEEDPLKWDFYNTFYFSYTVVSTIGYGNLAPTKLSSRIVMIFYAIIGIPINGILLANLGDFFSSVFIKAHRNYKSYKQEDDCQKKPKETKKFTFFFQILMYLVPGFVIFIFFPAFIFSYVEEWTYDQSVYYAFVTLTTIGFGDLVAGQNSPGGNFFVGTYKAFLIIWISFGLGYIVMIMTFITRGFKSKKITQLEHKLAMNIKHTQNKVFNQLTRDINYLRRIFNELQLSKVKRIYMDDDDYDTPPATLMRSNSFPDLRQLVYGGLEPITPPHPRRRANSEVVPMERTVARVVSETDLQRIDKNATFATHAMVQPAEMLARLVNILGYIPPPPDDDEQIDMDPRGVQGFSDKEILSGERNATESSWKLGGDRIPWSRKPRSRATSEVRLDPSFEPGVQSNQEWTWSGPAASRKIQEIMKARKNGASLSKDRDSGKDKECKSLFPLNLPKSVPLPRWIKQLSTKKDGRTRNSVSVGDLESNDDDYLSNVTGYTDRSTYFTHTGAADLSTSLEGSSLLEETTLADFIRALTALHSHVGAVPDEFIKKPQRKMGTASLTPPKLPSLFTLFAPPTESSSVPQSNQNTVTGAAARRFSLRTVENSSPLYQRKNSLAPAKPRNRRFSLRPVVTPLGTTPQASPYLSNLRKDSSSPPPAYSANFTFEGSKEPLVSMEGAPGVSSPVSTPAHRLSLHNSNIPGADSQVPAAKGLSSRWRAGILQRQLNQRRVRAFSLSDVNSDRSQTATDRNNSISPLALDPAVKTTTFGPRDPSNKFSTQKTVTIVSPSHENRGKTTDSKQSSAPTRRPFLRALSALNNPFSNSQVESRTTYTNPFVIDMESPELAATSEDLQSRNVSQGLMEVKNIKTVPLTRDLTDGSTSSDPTIVVIPGNDNNKINDDKIDRENASACATTGTGTGIKSDSKFVSGIMDNISREIDSIHISNPSISNWTDVRRDVGRKVSTVSECSSRDSSSESIKNSDKPRVSIDSYKSLIDDKIDRPSEDPFLRYSKASKQLNDNLRDESSSSHEQTKVPTGLGDSPRESST
ncbi:open rectifier potassium channel protein 1 [Microplitis demolitor]|uniref:open rectifier potassium channel protein 1 n=1 Tax=Microplitis demolitor TaxID=69319 RepID=UPI000440038A|nr:open rectifier potassium channel protein 1 [Microplitis demolitor]